MRGEYEMHHANWARRVWQKYPDFSVRKLRNHAGLIVPVHHTNHTLLHWELEPTPIPSHEVADDLLEHLGKPEDVTDRIATLKDAASFLISEAMSSPSPEYATFANRLGTHYVAQLGFIMLNEETAAFALREDLLRAA
jgi:hypothetical protein